MGLPGTESTISDLAHKSRRAERAGAIRRAGEGVSGFLQSLHRWLVFEDGEARLDAQTQVALSHAPQDSALLAPLLFRRGLGRSPDHVVNNPFKIIEPRGGDDDRIAPTSDVFGNAEKTAPRVLL